MKQGVFAQCLRLGIRLALGHVLGQVRVRVHARDHARDLLDSRVLDVSVAVRLSHGCVHMKTAARLRLERGREKGRRHLVHLAAGAEELVVGEGDEERPRTPLVGASSSDESCSDESRISAGRSSSDVEDSTARSPAAENMRREWSQGVRGMRRLRAGSQAGSALARPLRTLRQLCPPKWVGSFGTPVSRRQGRTHQRRLGRAREPSGAAARRNVSGHFSALEVCVFHLPRDQCKWAQPAMNEGERAVASGCWGAQGGGRVGRTIGGPTSRRARPHLGHWCTA